MHYPHNTAKSGRIRRLVETYCSRAAAKQRAGRAGRVQPGVCYRLVQREKFRSLAAAVVPEMRRVPLESTVLHIMTAHLGKDPGSSHGSNVS